MMLFRICMAVAVLAVTACTPMPAIQRTGLPLELRLSGNFDERRPNFVILHYTSSDNAARALNTLTDPFSKVSAHYLIARDGKIYALVDERARAWHAGVSYWGGNRDINSASIGIELDNNGAEAFAEPLLDALLALLAAFGYDTADPDAAIGAFKLHFVPAGDPERLTDQDRALLSCLLAKKRAGG